MNIFQAALKGFSEKPLTHLRVSQVIFCNLDPQIIHFRCYLL